MGMFLKKIKYKSNASRHSILKKNFSENIMFSKKIINTNNGFFKTKKKKTRYSSNKNKIYPCRLDLVPNKVIFVGEPKHFLLPTTVWVFFFDGNCLFFDSLPKGYDFF